MKKIFTLIAVAMMAITAMAQQTDTFNVTVTDGKITVAPTNAERGYYFGLVPATVWAGMEAEGYTFKSLIEEEVEDCTYDELVDYQYIWTGTVVDGWSPNFYMLSPGEYYFLFAYINKDVTVEEPVVVKLIVDEQMNFVLDEGQPTDDDTFNVTVTDGKITVAPTNVERGYYFGLVPATYWAGLEAEGYTFKSLIEEEVEDCTYGELVDYQYIWTGTVVDGWSPNFYMLSPGEYYFLFAYINKDVTVEEPVVVKLFVDEQGNFVLDEATAIKNANVDAMQLRKFIENGKIVMMKDGKKFNVAGMLVK